MKDFPHSRHPSFILAFGRGFSFLQIGWGRGSCPNRTLLALWWLSARMSRSFPPQLLRESSWLPRIDGRWDIAKAFNTKGTIHTFFDYNGNKLGETKMAMKFGIATGATLIYDSTDELRGKLKTGMFKESTIFGFKTITIPAYTLEDALGQRIAISDSFKFKVPLGHDVCIFENLRKDGLNIKAPDGNIVVTIKAASSIDAVQIDLLSPKIDRLSILCLIIDIIC